MSKFEFNFVTGETAIVEAEEKWLAILEDEDRQEYNNNQRETRRHCSLEDYNRDDALLPSDVDVEREVLTALDNEELRAAIGHLAPKQRNLTGALFFGDVKLVDYAAREGVKPSAISQRKATILKKLKKFLS